MDFPIIKDKKNTLVFIRAVQKGGIFNLNNSKPTIIFHKKAHRWNCAYNNFIKNYFAKYFKYVHYIVFSDANREVNVSPNTTGYEQMNNNGIRNDIIYYYNDKEINSISKSNITYWRFNSIKFFIDNFSCDNVFLRGDYSRVYDLIYKNFKNIVLYRAGCLSNQPRLYDRGVNVYLYDDKKSITYKNAKSRFKKKCRFIKMLKSAPLDFEYQNKEKKYDILIVSKETPLAENYKLIYELLDHLLIKKIIDLKILIVGFRDKAEKRIKEIYKKYKILDLELHPIVSKVKIIEYYNTSNILFVPTIHDGNPRIICEAYSCGLKPVCSSLLMNGKDQIREYGGAVIKYDKKFYSNLVNESKKEYDKVKLANAGKEFGKKTARSIFKCLFPSEN